MALRLRRDILVDSSHWQCDDIFVGSKNGNWLAIEEVRELLFPEFTSASSFSFCCSDARAMSTVATAKADVLVS